MQCTDVEVALEQEGLSPLPQAARAHLLECHSCQNLVADLTAIVTGARELPPEVDPPPRVWNSLRAQLEAEGIVKTPATVGAERLSWWRAFPELFRTRALATAVVGLLIVSAIALQLERPSTPSPTEARNLYAATAQTLNTDEASLANIQLASSSFVDASLRQNLQIVDQFIAECEQRVREEPQDDLAGVYLSGAYQQKAELLSAMMEREGSVN